MEDGLGGDEGRAGGRAELRPPDPPVVVDVPAGCPETLSSSRRGCGPNCERAAPASLAHMRPDKKGDAQRGRTRYAPLTSSHRR